MAKKVYPRSEAIQAETHKDDPAFYTWSDPKDKALIIRESAKSLSSYQGVSRASYDNYSNLLPGISARPEFTQNTYDAFRPEQRRPLNYKEIITRCNSIYHTVGLIKNVIDLMGDFGCQGVRPVHPNKNIEKFYQNWFKRINGMERSERFLNYLYRLGNVVVRRRTVKINVKLEERLYKTHASPDFTSYDVLGNKVEKREIPWTYTFLDPSTVGIVGGALASFVGDPLYCLQLPDALKRQILAPKTEAERQIIAQLPPDIIQAAKSNREYVLPADKIIVYHYKKDDWANWANPMIYSILKDAMNLDKLKLADNAALDGAISWIRIFKLGSIEGQIMPSPAAAAKLAEILQSNVHAGSLDIVWGPDIELIESKSEVYKFLGEEKYKPTLNAIYAGLGIPPTLTGTFGAAGTTNNFISLKTLTQRLEYGRAILTAFWEYEFELIRQAMDFRFAAKLEYDLMNLGNDDAIKALYIRLAEENVLSDETLQRIFEQDPEMERVRLNREARDRDNGRMVNKSGPYYEPQASESLKKMAMQQGLVTPSEVGVKLKENKDGQVPMIDKKHEQDIQKIEKQNQAKIAQQKLSNRGPNGRPKNAKDTQKRKTKTFSPKARATLEIWATRAQTQIAEILNPAILGHFGKSNFRQLTTDEYDMAEKMKFGVLFHMVPLGEVSETAVLENSSKQVPSNVNYILKEYLEDLGQLGKSPTYDDLKRLQIKVYADYIAEKE